MKSFKDLLLEKFANHSLINPSVSLASASRNHKISLKLDNKDTIVDAVYEGHLDPWLGSLCYLLIGKSLHEATNFTLKTWETFFQADPTFWEFQQDQAREVFFPALELLRAALDDFRAREELYLVTDPLICRCFGVREKAILDHIRSVPDITLENLSQKTKAGMGCRSCLLDLKSYIKSAKSESGRSHFYKEKSLADWLLEIDSVLRNFPDTIAWGFEIESLKNNQVIISYTKLASQSQAEEMSQKIQRFLSESVDPDLVFFLRRA